MHVASGDPAGSSAVRPRKHRDADGIFAHDGVFGVEGTRQAGKDDGSRARVGENGMNHDGAGIAPAAERVFS